MTDQELDRLMRRVLLDAIALDEASCTEQIPFEPSLRHQKQVAAMLENPLRWARERSKPVWKKMLQKVAVILLVLSLGLGGVMFASPTVRAAVITRMREMYEHSVVYNLVWIDETRGIVFTINSTLEKYVILHIAESAFLSNLKK